MDFNGDNPAVFTGSSNLAEGGEQANGDSLIMIEDQVLAAIDAIEALKIFDHYAFRERMKSATDAKPLTLWYPGKAGAPQPWWTLAYDQKNIKYRDRCLFADIALPGTLQSHKNVDWSSLGHGAAPAAAQEAVSAGASTGSGEAGKPRTKTSAKKSKTAAKKPVLGKTGGKKPAKKAPPKVAPKQMATTKNKAAPKKKTGAKTATRRNPSEKAPKTRAK